MELCLPLLSIPEQLLQAVKVLHTSLSLISIPIFSGDPLQWQSFWDCFEAAVDHNSSITNVQKLNYLRTQL